MPLDSAIDVLLGASFLCLIGASAVGVGVALVYVAVVLPLRFLAAYTIAKIKGLGHKD